MIRISSLLFFVIHIGLAHHPDFQAGDKGKALSSIRESTALGERLFNDGNYAKAFEHFERALKSSTALGYRDEELKILEKLGLTAWNLGKMEASASSYSRALEIARADGRKEVEEQCRTALEIYRLYGKGKNCRSSGQYGPSIKYFEEAVLLSRAIRSPNHEIKCLRQLSLNYWERAEIEEYFRLNQRGQELAHRINNHREEGICQNNLGLYYWKKNEFSSAIKCFQSSLEIANREGSPENISDSLTNISLVYMDLGDYEKALDHLNRGISLDQELNNSYNFATDLNNLGNIYLNMGVQAQNDQLFERALESLYQSLILAYGIQNSRLQSIVQNNIGEVFSVLDQSDKALHYFNKSLRNANESGFLELISLLNNNIANMYLRQGLFDRAMGYYRASIQIAARINYEKDLWESSFGLAQCYEGNRQDLQAAEYYDNAVQLIEKARSRIYLDPFKVGYSRNKSRVYESFVDFIHRSKTKGGRSSFEENLFYYIEKAKARAFVEIVQGSKIDVEAKMDLAKRKELDESSKKISSLYLELMKNDLRGKDRKELGKRLSQEEDNYLRIISIMKVIDPSMASLVHTEPYPLTSLQTQGGLDGETAILEYFIGEKKSYLLFITQKSCEIFALPPRRSIEESIKAYLKYVSSPPEKHFNGLLAARRIFKEFLFPLGQDSRNDVSRLIIIPDGILHYLPFEALAISGNENSAEYLIDKYQVSYAPSVTALMLLKTAIDGLEPDRGLMAFGNPASERHKIAPAAEGSGRREAGDDLSPEAVLSPLPYAKREIRSISKYFPKDRRLVYLGTEANEDNLKARTREKYQIIHFAGHSLLDEAHPLRSALILEPGRDGANDGIFQVRELYDVKLTANLVILSACQTGMGLLEKGEGFLCLQRAFFFSGAKSVLSTLWPVKDRSTAFFMENYYRFLAEGQSKASALRSAKKKMIRSKYSHPYHWAGFLLSGEPDAKIKFQ